MKTYYLSAQFKTHTGWYGVGNFTDKDALRTEIKILLEDEGCTSFKVEIA